MVMDTPSEKPHAVIVPFPTQGHINPLLKLSKLLHHRGFHITFVNTVFNHNRLLTSTFAAQSPPPHFCFETIPDGLPADASQDLAVLNDSTRKNCLLPFRQLLTKLNNSPQLPPVSCIVSDGVMSFTLQAFQELHLPNVVFWTFGACGFLGFTLLLHLVNRGITPFKDSSYLTDGTLESFVDWQEGLKNYKLKHIPAFIRTTDPQDLMLDIIKGELEAAKKASALILHTFDALEHQTLNIIHPMFPPVYAIGPLQLLVDDHIPHDSNLQSMDCSLWKQDDGCLEWLSSKEENSVLYVNFGSIAVLSQSEILELGWGIAHSKKNFLWIIRPDLLAGKSGALPPDFLDEIKERGLILSWCNQEKVLGHPSVGGFLTHCGWNSTIEGITAGVPFLCLPCLSEQPTNCKYVCDEWRFGLEIGKNSERDEISGTIKKLMDGEEGKEMKKRAMELKIKAVEATSSPHGSSFLNFEKLVTEVLVA